MKTLRDVLADRPADRDRVDAHKARMLAEVRAYRLRELREDAGLTQVDLAERIGVGQRQVSKIEHGDLDNTKIGTIRAYVEAVGGALDIEFVVGDQRIRISSTADSSRVRKPRKSTSAATKSVARAKTARTAKKAAPKTTARKQAVPSTPKAMTGVGRG